MSYINQQVSQLLVQIQNAIKPNKAQNPIKPKNSGLSFFKTRVFLNPNLCTGTCFHTLTNHFNTHFPVELQLSGY